MKQRTLFSTGIAIATLAVVTAQPAGQAGSTAFVGVSVIPMENEAVLADQAVLVSEGKIASIVPAAKAQIPAGAIRVEGKGKFLMPALAEMHAHIPGGAAPDRRSSGHCSSMSPME